MSTFVLVHGAWHGAWCWEPLVAELGHGGHRCVTMDLPCEDVDATFEDYVDAALAAVDAAGVDSAAAHFVGHSLGSVTVARAALRRPVASVVHLCGVVPAAAGSPRDGEPKSEVAGAFDSVVRDPAGANFWPDAEGARRSLYSDCPVAVADAAWARLRRQGFGIWRDNPPLPHYPDVPTATVVCADDRVISPEWSRWVAQHWLHVEPVEMPGDHSPMLSRPGELAAVLARITG